MVKAKTSKTRVQSVERAMDILQQVSKAAQPMSVQQIADELQLHPNTVGNLARTLYYKGYLAQPVSGRFASGPQCLNLANSTGRLAALRNVAEPIVKQLAADTGDNAFLGVDQENELYCVMQSRGSGAIVVSNSQVWLNQIHCTATGQVLLAWKCAENPDALDFPLQKITAHTITSKPKLKRKLTEIRKTGYAVCIEESCIGVSSVAVPVFDRDCKIIAALGQGFPSFYLENGQIDAKERSNRLHQASREITSALPV